MAGMWLLSLGALFVLSNAQDAYDLLPGPYRKGVDIALKKVGSHPGIQLHFRFFLSVTKSDVEVGHGVSYVYHQFLLKPTTCPKGAMDPTACSFRNDRPLIDCVTCYKMFAGEIEQEPRPFVHCIHRPSLTEEMKTERVNHCNAVSYSSGGPSLLASKSKN